MGCCNNQYYTEHLDKESESGWFAMSVRLVPF
jgi:hypothetical protein